MTNVAAVDCGSNSTRLLITDDDGRTLHRDMRITRLSQGVDASGALTAEALARTVAVLGEYRTIMDRFDVSRGLVVATSAVRDAVNGDEFLRAASETTGLEARCLRGEEEARFSLLGATAGLAPSDQPTLVVDIGGGSTELAALVDGQLEAFSMQLGCVRVTERALGSDVVTDERRAAAVDMIEAELDRAFALTPAFTSLVGGVRLVGVAGTVATLAQLVTGQPTYVREAVHHQTLHRSDVQAWISELGSRTPAQRLALPGMVPGREDVLVAGLLVLDAVLARFAVSTFLTSEDDILDGVATAVRINGVSPQ